MSNRAVKILAQPSTWRGLVLILTSLGVGISPEFETHIVATGLAIAGFIGATCDG